MVFRGKPSKACAPCRRRRIKCDRVEPACAQCVRADLECHGYRDVADLRFADETEHTKSKVLVRQSDKAISPDAVQVVPKPKSPSTSIDDQAYLFFVKNYVGKGYDKTSGLLDYIPEIFKSSGNQILTLGMTCVGMGSIANITNDADMMVAARQKYSAALRVTNTALQDLESARSDQTLASVILLGIFEQTTGKTHKSIDAWTQHVDGATALMRLRGVEQFKSKTRIRLFEKMRAQVIAVCLQKGIPVPVELEYLMQQEKIAQPTSPWGHLSRLAAKLCYLRACVVHKTITDQSTLVNMIFDLDKELNSWPAQLDEGWQYKVVDGPTEDAYPGPHHVYGDLFQPMVWNNFRCVQILLYETLLHLIDNRDDSILACIPNLDSLQMYHRRARASTAKLAGEICASVPYCLNQCPFEPTPAGVVSLLMWPMLVAGTTDYCPRDLRTWLVERLQYISSRTGLALAMSLANVVRHTTPISPATLINGKAWWDTSDGEMDADSLSLDEWRQALGTDLILPPRAVERLVEC